MHLDFYVSLTSTYKYRSPQLITPPQFAPLYRTSSPLITVSQALPWQMNNTFIIVMFYSFGPGNAPFPCKLEALLFFQSQKICIILLKCNNINMSLNLFNLYFHCIFMPYTRLNKLGFNTLFLLATIFIYY